MIVVAMMNSMMLDAWPIIMRSNGTTVNIDLYINTHNYDARWSPWSYPWGKNNHFVCVFVCFWHSLLCRSILWTASLIVSRLFQLQNIFLLTCLMNQLCTSKCCSKNTQYYIDNCFFSVMTLSRAQCNAQNNLCFLFIYFSPQFHATFSAYKFYYSLRLTSTVLCISIFVMLSFVIFFSFSLSLSIACSTIHEQKNALNHLFVFVLRCAALVCCTVNICIYFFIVYS